MKTYLPTRRHLLKTAGAIAAAAPFASLLADDSGLQAIKGQSALDARKVLDGLPYASEGTGAPIWILSSSRCGFCLDMNTKRRGPVPGLAINYIAYPLLSAESGAVARAWRERDSDGYRRYMAGEFARTRPIPIEPPTARSRYAAIPDAELTDAQFYNKRYAEILSVKANWARADGSIESVTPESYILMRPESEAILLRVPGDGVPLLRSMLKKYPSWFANL